MLSFFFLQTPNFQTTTCPLAFLSEPSSCSHSLSLLQLVPASWMASFVCSCPFCYWLLPPPSHAIFPQASSNFASSSSCPSMSSTCESPFLFLTHLGSILALSNSFTKFLTTVLLVFFRRIATLICWFCILSPFLCLLFGCSSFSFTNCSNSPSFLSLIIHLLLLHVLNFSFALSTAHGAFPHRLWQIFLRTESTPFDNSLQASLRTAVSLSCLVLKELQALWLVSCHPICRFQAQLLAVALLWCLFRSTIPLLMCFEFVAPSSLAHFFLIPVSLSSLSVTFSSSTCSQFLHCDNDTHSSCSSSLKSTLTLASPPLSPTICFGTCRTSIFISFFSAPHRVASRRTHRHVQTCSQHPKSLDSPGI